MWLLFMSVSLHIAIKILGGITLTFTNYNSLYSRNKKKDRALLDSLLYALPQYLDIALRAVANIHSGKIRSSFFRIALIILKVKKDERVILFFPPPLAPFL
jgi:hypothetical protein